MKLQKIGMLVVAALICGSAVADNEVAITGVTAQQRYPWNGKVDIVVTITGDTNLIANTECIFVATNSATQVELPVSTISLAGEEVLARDAYMRRYVWDATADVGEVKIDDVAFTVNLKEMGGVQLWKNGPYWAECNVGASRPEAYGYYFQWGDIIGYKRNANNDGWVSVDSGTAFQFTESNCLTRDKSYAELQELGYTDSAGKLVAEHDAATQHCGAPWRMPTCDELSALVSNCDTTWITTNGVSGRLVTGKGEYADKSIFLPAAGQGYKSDFSAAGSYGYYWSSSSRTNNLTGAYCNVFDSHDDISNRSTYRELGNTVRPIREYTDGVTYGSGVTTHLTLDFDFGQVAITSITAKQRYPWNGKVDIVVTITGDVSKVNVYECTFSATNSATQEKLSVTTISRMGSDVIVGDECTRRYVWDASADVGEVTIDDVELHYYPIVEMAG